MFVAAAEACGWRRNPDFNAQQQEGVGFYQVTQRRGRRCSTAVAYLRPVQSRANLTIRTGCQVLRVVLDAGRAAGVEYRQRGSVGQARAQREVLLAAGAIGSPQLLLLSGIGPVQALESLRIPVEVDSPEVGSNLQDHLDFCTLAKCTRPVTYDFDRRQEAWVALRYLITRSGPGVSNVAEAGGFIRTPLAPDERADVQLHFVPAQLDDHGRNRLAGHGFTVHACALRPASRGVITLRSSRAEDPPRIQPSYLSAAHDLDTMLEAIRVSREILHASPFARYLGEEIFPGPNRKTREELHQVIRSKAETIYHPVGTCRMGSDCASVVDADLRVRGVGGLRVIDASVMPRLIGGNTNAPTIMIAEKAADLLL